jgi:hypothetical protein
MGVANLNEDAMDGNDVDDQQTPIIKLPQACEHITRLLSNFAVEHPSEFSVTEAMNMQSLMDKLSKMSISNTNKTSFEHNKSLLS